VTGAGRTPPAGTRPGGTGGTPVEVVTVTPNPVLEGVNVAAALASAGHRVASTGWLGADNAAAFEAFFAASGIEDRFVRSPRQTPSPSERAELMERVLGLASTAATGLPGWFVLAGSLPPGVDPGFYCELATLATAAGARVALDTGGEPLRRALKSEPQVLKPNVDELEDLVGTPLSGRSAIVAAARGLLKGEMELVVVSLGADGALFVERGRAVVAQPPRVVVRSAAGAGDAMMAGIVTGRLRRLELGELARLASAFALEAVTGKAAVEWLGEVAVEEVGAGSSDRP
jgi:1-phosphofructokinase